MKKQKRNLKQLVDKDWSLFLDRDGVINRRIVGDYVVCTEQFKFIPGVLEALKKFAEYFRYIFVVTNQQGIGKGLMTEADLLKIHSQMINTIQNYGGRIDQVYYCPYIANENHIDRKPNVGMGLKARKKFQGVNFKKSIMVGDSLSDMEFGNKLGMVNVFISESMSLPDENVHIDFLYKNLFEFSLDL